MADPAQSRSNQGYLYPNEKTNERQPDYRGKLNVEGKEFLVSGWIRQRDGKDMISLSLTDPATLPPRGGQGGGQGGQGVQGGSAPTSQGQSSGPPAGVGNIFDDLPG